MKFLPALVLFLIVIGFGAQTALAAERKLDHSLLKQLSTLKVGEALTVDAFPVGPTRLESIRFSRVSVYSNDSHLYEETASGRIELPRSTRTYLHGYANDGRTRVALALDADASFAHGAGAGPEGSFLLHGTKAGSSTNLVARKMEPPAGSKFDFRCATDDQSFDVPALDAVGMRMINSLETQVATTAHALRFAIVAVDTDSLFMSKLFNNNSTNATNWIAGMFNTMNLMYETDLLVQLRIGTTILRTNPGTDPYSGFTPGASTAELDTFSNYWRTNEAAVTRSFAILLSGVLDSSDFGCSSSGLAWVNQYCEKGFTLSTHTVGSYSINQVCTSLIIDPDGSFDALTVGHEIGHNFGAYHTHCTNASTGVPTASNFIDQCHSGEMALYNNQSFACYSGSTSCPAAGAGTIMSYCNFPDSGCPANTDNLLEFHPAHIAKLDEYIAAAPGGCFNTTDDVFFSNFE